MAKPCTPSNGSQPTPIETFNLLPINLHQILEPQTTSLMIHNPHINALVCLILQTGSPIVVQQATTLPSSLISKISHPASYLSPLLMAVPNYLPTKAPQNVFDDGIGSKLGLTEVYYVEGLSLRLLSLTALSCTQNFSALIRNRANAIQLPNNSSHMIVLLHFAMVYETTSP